MLILGGGFADAAAGVPTERWLISVAAGTLWCLVLADGIQRRWRGDPRTREPGPDRRTNAATTVAFAAMLPVGAWSYWQGHRTITWALLLGTGLLGVALGLQKRAALAQADPTEAPSQR